MIMNKDEIKDTIKDDDDKTNRLLNKSRIRHVMFGDGNDNVNDEWLKPWCFDQWKKFIHDKKLWRKNLWHMQMFTGTDDKSKLGRAFCKWKSDSKRFIKYLNGLTQEELMALANKYREELDAVANQIEEAQEEITDLKTQREYLIDKVVLGQRLALARCRFSFTYAKEKTWVRMLDNVVASYRGSFGQQISDGIGLID